MRYGENMNKYTLGYFQSNANIERRVRWVLRSGRLSYGPMSVAFERELANIIKVRNVILCNSGTSALHVALQSAKLLHGWEDGDEIICPALTFVATINAVINNNLKPVLVDIESSSFGIDIGLIEEKITERARAILPVHLFGAPVNMGKIMAIARKHNLVVIEDACEAFGAKHAGKPVGSIGSIGCFSTYIGHHIVTGVGGFCTTNDDLYAIKIRSLVNHGIDTSQLPVGAEYEPTHLGRIFNFTDIGHSFRITELEAALGLGALEAWGDALLARQRNAWVLEDALSGVQNLSTLMVRHDATYSWMMFPIVYTPLFSDESIAAINMAGIEARRMMPLTNQPCYDFKEEDFPVAKRVNDHGFYIGCHEGISATDALTMAKILKKVLPEAALEKKDKIASTDN